MAVKSFEKTVFLFIAILGLLLAAISTGRLPQRAQKAFSWKEDGGIRIISVGFKEAESAGLKTEDILTAIDGDPIDEGLEIEFFHDSHKAGSRATLTILRNGNPLQIPYVLSAKYNAELIIVNLLVGMCFWIIALIVFFKRPELLQARVFGWTNLFIAISSFLLWPGYPFQGEIQGYVTAIANFFFWPIVPSLVLLFFLLFPAQRKWMSRNRWIWILLPGILFALMLEIHYWPFLTRRSFESYRIFWRLYNLFRLYAALMFLSGLISLGYSFFTFQSREMRNKSRWILAFTGAGLFPYLFLWTLPLALNLNPPLPETVTYIFLILIPAGFGHALIRYRLMDIHIIIRRSLIYGLLTASIIVGYLILAGVATHLFNLISHQSRQIVTIVFTLAAAALFAPLKSTMQTFVDRTFYRERTNYQQAMKEFSENLTQISHPMEIIQSLLDGIEEAIPVKTIAALIYDPGKKNTARLAGRGDSYQSQILNCSFGKIFQSSGEPLMPLLREAGKKTPDVKELPSSEFEDSLELIIPVILPQETIGLLLMGEKRSERRYSERDLELMVPMAQEGFMALGRALLEERVADERAQRERSEEIRGLQTQFLSHVSHELRNPLASIRWSLENLLDGIPEMPGPAIQPYLTGMLQSVQHLRRMIENLLNVTRIEAGRIHFIPESLDLRTEIDKSINLIRALSDAKAVSYRIRIPRNLTVMADPDCFQEIMVNLLSNAVNYSPAGARVEIVASASNSNSGKTVTLSVNDQGPGIPAAMRKSVFERFVRLKSQSDRNGKGLGLGLFIVKTLVDLHRGQIHITRSKQGGSSFLVTLPRK